MKIEFHYTYLILLFSFLITGYFPNIIIFTSIIIIHELGHYLVAKSLNLNPYKIIIYPYGGITKSDNMVNTPIAKEMLISVSGILFQSIYYFIIYTLYKHNLVREYIFEIYRTYHMSILFFNILPIHPLDGSIFVNNLISLFIPLRITMYLNLIISIIAGSFILTLNYHYLNYTSVLIVSIIINYLYKYLKNINYLYNRFLLERYLYHLTYMDTKIINNYRLFYKEKKHIITYNDTYFTEKQFLSMYFKEKS